jgi:hypothetical protein
MAQGSGLRVQGSGFRVQAIVKGKVQDIRFGSGTGIQGSGSRLKDKRVKGQDKQANLGPLLFLLVEWLFFRLKPPSFF